jgi:hypothetical protein
LLILSKEERLGANLMKKQLILVSAILAVVATVSGALLGGCDDITTGSLTITPARPTLTISTNSVVLTVSSNGVGALSLPITWEVSDDTLGEISSQSGYIALYKRFASDGVNSITATDQYGSEGYASIKQVQNDSSLSITVTKVGPDTWTLTISPATKGPYGWWVRNSTLGEVTVLGTGLTAVYEADATLSGLNTIYAADVDGAAGAVNIRQ